SSSTNTPIFNFIFEDLKEKVRTCSESDEYRDVFKNIKNALIKDGNLLGASRFHKMELYCKEIELGLKRKENRETSIRDFADKIQLMFYRLTSDHHTDLLLVLNNVLGLIMLFSIFVFCLFYYADYSIICIDSPYCFLKEVYIISPTVLEYFCSNCILSNLFYWEISTIIVVCIIFTIMFLLMMWFINFVHVCCQELDYCFIVFFVFLLFILAVKPAIMLPIFGKLIDESLKIDFPAFTSLSVVYAILMFLLIWSLQKTARKNTIVPN
ncbi:MAG: hypothetical protein K2N69_05680, partial [Helicobacter sp.]|nr:hypothetical protein [Helicobacter sp.]